MSDHNYDPEKIRDVIQDHLYRGPEPLGNAEPSESAEEIEDGVKVWKFGVCYCNVYFRVMGSWFSFSTTVDRIEKGPTIAEEFVDYDLSGYEGEIWIDQRLEYTKLRFEDGSEAKMFGSYREAL